MGLRSNDEAPYCHECAALVNERNEFRHRALQAEAAVQRVKALADLWDRRLTLVGAGKVFADQIRRSLCSEDDL